MKITFILFTLIYFSGIGFSADDHKAKENIPLARGTVANEGTKFNLSASLGEDTSPSGYRQLFIFSSEALKEVEFKVGEAENWNKMDKAAHSNPNSYSTQSYLPSAPGQKFSVRGIRSDGSRVTSLLVVDPKEGKLISVNTVKEESKAEVEAEKKSQQASLPVTSDSSNTPWSSNTPRSSNNFGSSQVLMQAQSNVGRCLGNGTCAALSGGSRIGQISGSSGYQQVQPGQVLRFSPGSSFSSGMGRFTVSSQGHYVVVESIQPDGSFTFLHQNWAGGSSHGKNVRRETGNLRTLNGSATIYSGN